MLRVVFETFKWTLLTTRIGFFRLCLSQLFYPCPMDVVESPPLPLQPVQQRDPYLRLKQQQKQLEMLSIQVCESGRNFHKLSLMAVPF